jgi:signal transduction histidine kinase
MSTARKHHSKTLPDPLNWTSSDWVVILLAALIGLLSILLSVTLDWVLYHEVRRLYASDFVEGMLAAVLSGAALLRAQAKNRELLVRMQIVEDVNHHVRNALTGIVLSASLREDADLNARVREACARIDWVLSDVLSQSVNAGIHDGEHPQWRTGRRL